MRFLFLLLIAGAIACFAYPFTGDFSLFIEAALWIYSLTIAFLIDKAIARRSALRQSVNIELARLRHIHHVSEQFEKTFSKKINKLLVAYEHGIEMDFQAYHKSTKVFRELSHAVYSFSPKTKKDVILYTDLLQTLQDLALDRQSIQFELTSELAFYDWFLIILVLTCLLTLLLVHIDPLAPFLRFTLTFTAVLVTLIPMEMLWKYDRYSASAIKKFQTAYGQNITKK